MLKVLKRLSSHNEILTKELGKVTEILELAGYTKNKDKAPSVRLAKFIHHQNRRLKFWKNTNEKNKGKGILKS